MAVLDYIHCLARNLLRAYQAQIIYKTLRQPLAANPSYLQLTPHSDSVACFLDSLNTLALNKGYLLL